MPQWAAHALLRPVRRFEGIPYGNAQNALGRLQSEAERHLRGFLMSLSPGTCLTCHAVLVCTGDMGPLEQTGTVEPCRKSVVRKCRKNGP